MLKNDYLVAKIGVDTAEKEPFQEGLLMPASALRGHLKAIRRPSGNDQRKVAELVGVLTVLAPRRAARLAPDASLVSVFLYIVVLPQRKFRIYFFQTAFQRSR